MTWTTKAQLKGPRGVEGPQGPRGLDGLNSVPTDKAVAGLVTSASSTETRRAVEQAVDLRKSALGLLFAGIAGRDERRSTVVTLGSSTTANGGWVGALSRSFQQAYPLKDGLIQAEPTSSLTASSLPKRGIQFVNSAVAGTTSANYCSTAKAAQIGALNPDAVFHMVGSNDYAEGLALASYKANIIAAMNEINAASPKPVVHVLIHGHQRTDRATASYAHPWSSYGDVLEEIAAERPATVYFINLHPFFARIGIPGADFHGFVRADYIHLHEPGQQYYADLLRDCLGVSGQAVRTVVAKRPTVVHVSASDSLGGTGALIGRSTDGAYGGSSEVWQVSPASPEPFRVEAGITPTVNKVAAFAALPVSGSVQVSAYIEALPSVGNLYLEINRQSLTGTPDGYRLIIQQNQVQLAKRSGGVTTYLHVFDQAAQITGATWAVQYYFRQLTLLRDGEPMFSVRDFDIDYGGYAGVARTDNAVGGKVSRVVVARLA